MKNVSPSRSLKLKKLRNPLSRGGEKGLQDWDGHAGTLIPNTRQDVGVRSIKEKRDRGRQGEGGGDGGGEVEKEATAERSNGS